MGRPMLDALEIHDIEQGTPEWHQVRAGVVTASRFKDVLAKGDGRMRRTYMHQLAGELVTGRPMVTYKSAAMERGNDQEAEARDLYAFMTDADPIQTGFMRNGRVGYSPDALIGDDGVLEIKTKEPHLMVGVIEKGKFPTEHMAQCQGALWVSGREWIDLAVYCPGFPLFVKRMQRDEDYIAILRSETAKFVEDLDALVERVSQHGRAA